MRPATLLHLALAALALPAGVYRAAGLGGAAWPTNRGWRPAAHGVMVWIEDNGIHTGIVVPKRAAGVDWRATFPRGDLRDPRYGAHDHLAIGWGERGFFVGTPTWRDVRPATVLRAAIGSDDTVLHVEHVARPVGDAQVRAVVLGPGQYRRLAAAMRTSLAPGRPTLGYAGYDAFYPARGRYDAVHTCNEWTGSVLRRAGITVGRWTPFPATVAWWLPRDRPR